MGLDKFKGSSSEIKTKAFQKKGANLPDGVHKMRITGMSSSESSKGDLIRIDLVCVSSVIVDKFTREHQGKTAEVAFFMPGDDATRTQSALERFFRTLKTIFGKVPEGELSDATFKQWAKDAQGKAVKCKKTTEPNPKDDTSPFVNVYINESAALTDDDMKALGLDKKASDPVLAGEATLAPAGGDFADDIPF